MNVGNGVLKVRVLLIGDRGVGGIKSYAKTLSDCLKGFTPCFNLGEDELFIGRNGHDIRDWFQIRRIVREFRPDIIHVNKFSLMMLLYLKFFTQIPRVVSLHMSYDRRLSIKDRILFWALRPCYFLPVSSATWAGFRAHYPAAKGEVFFNPIRLALQDRESRAVARKDVIGMVGRNADAKDWPSFHRVAELVGGEAWNLGEKSYCPNASEKIAEMSVFVMTSKHEQMPTTMLECFLKRTPICGFIPKGGVRDVLALSNGALRSVFIDERDPYSLAEIAKRLLRDDAFRKAVIDDQCQILANHFDAEKNCRGQLMDVYRKVIARNV